MKMIQRQLKKWGIVAQNIVPQPHIKIHKTYFSLLRFIRKANWEGGCHASSSILHLLLSEQGFDSKLFIGEVGVPPIVFDHSWVEVDQNVYDAAIANTLVKGFTFPPVFANIDLDTGDATKLKYGMNSGQGFDPAIRHIKQIPFELYMNNFPDHPKGLWGLTKDIGKGIGLRINLGRLRKKYSDTVWHERAHN